MPMITFRQTIHSDYFALRKILSATLCLGDALSSDMGECVSGWVCCDDGDPVGFALANRKAGKILVVAVLPEFGGRGIGSELMRQAEDWLSSHGFGEIRLELLEKCDERVVGFFQHLGWKFAGVAKPEDECLVLKKENPRRASSWRSKRLTIPRPELNCLQDIGRAEVR